MDRYAQYFLVAGQQALTDAGIAYEEDDPEAFRFDWNGKTIDLREPLPAGQASSGIYRALSWNWASAKMNGPEMWSGRARPENGGTGMTRTLSLVSALVAMVTAAAAIFGAAVAEERYGK